MKCGPSHPHHISAMHGLDGCMIPEHRYRILAASSTRKHLLCPLHPILSSVLFHTNNMCPIIDSRFAFYPKGLTQTSTIYPFRDKLALIGFVFTSSKCNKTFTSPYFINTYIYFQSRKIGFVFSNCFSTTPRKFWGLNKLALIGFVFIDSIFTKF